MKNVICLVSLSIISCVNSPAIIPEDGAQVKVIVPCVDDASVVAHGCLFTDRMNAVSFGGRICNPRWSIGDLPLLFRGPSHMQSDIVAAATILNAAAGIELAAAYGSSGAIVKIEEDNFDGGAYLGIASWGYSGFLIVQGNIKVWSGFGPSPKPDRVNVLVHEMLHIFDIKHDKGCSIMSPGYCSGPGGTEIASFDIEALRLAYGQAGVLVAPLEPVCEQADMVQTTVIEHDDLGSNHIEDGPVVSVMGPNEGL